MAHAMLQALDVHPHQQEVSLCHCKPPGPKGPEDLKVLKSLKDSESDLGHIEKAKLAKQRCTMLLHAPFSQTS